MSAQPSIVAVIEPDTHPQEVAERAAWLALLYDLPVDLLLCDADIGPLHTGWFLSDSAESIADLVASAQEEMIEEIADNIRDLNVAVTTTVLEERPIVDAILHDIDARSPKVLVKGTQHHSDSDRALFAATDWQLIRRCPCPLYLVKPQPMPENPIVVASVDPVHAHDKPAELDGVIVQYAQDIATRTAGELHLFHTYQRLIGVGSEATRTFKPLELPIKDIDERMKQEHRDKLDALAAQFDVKEDNVHQLPGKTQALLPQFVRANKAGLVVMGALARWGLKRAIIGSTAERVLDKLPCDVLIVRQ